MKQISDEIRIAIFNQSIGCEVVLIPWSRRYNPKATLAPDLKMGVITSADINGNCSIKTIEGNTTFNAKSLILLKKNLLNVSTEDCLSLTNIIYTQYYDENTTETVQKNDADVIKSDIATMFKHSRWSFSAEMSFHVLQYLQSKNYALPYLNYTVQDLIELEIYI